MSSQYRIMRLGLKSIYRIQYVGLFGRWRWYKVPSSCSCYDMPYDIEEFSSRLDALKRVYQLEEADSVALLRARKAWSPVL